MQEVQVIGLLVVVHAWGSPTPPRVRVGRIGHAVARSPENSSANIRRHLPRACQERARRRAKRYDNCKTEHEGQDPVPDNGPEDRQNEDGDQDRYGVLGIHRLEKPAP